MTQSNTKTDEEIVKEFENMFWLTRIPKHTKQLKDVTDWFTATLSQVRTQAQKEVVQAVWNEIDGKEAVTADTMYRLMEQFWMVSKRGNGK